MSKLAKLEERLQTHGWSQEYYRSPDGQLCIGAAAALVAGFPAREVTENGIGICEVSEAAHKNHFEVLYALYLTHPEKLIVSEDFDPEDYVDLLSIVEELNEQVQHQDVAPRVGETSRPLPEGARHRMSAEIAKLTETIQTRGWRTGVYEDVQSGPVCLVGAAAIIAGVPVGEDYENDGGVLRLSEANFESEIRFGQLLDALLETRPHDPPNLKIRPMGPHEKSTYLTLVNDSLSLDDALLWAALADARLMEVTHV